MAWEKAGGEKANVSSEKLGETRRQFTHVALAHEVMKPFPSA
jgi:hypothetical protein